MITRAKKSKNTIFSAIIIAWDKDNVYNPIYPRKPTGKTEKQVQHNKTIGPAKLLRMDKMSSDRNKKTSGRLMMACMPDPEINAAPVIVKPQQVLYEIIVLNPTIVRHESGFNIHLSYY